ncbi:hypothetical protein L1I30_05965 [Gillisia sp. M10.2A]|uniref:Uncharacterized protein n=1 Tax=Gillisia lutea TaxID=2909668 RepID=A0ABS9EEI2_9FLAO|nr:hypothetical protein [Gillisia lutea]MCF4101203.1 hypothetical protein [Gillisia lutea]
MDANNQNKGSFTSNLKDHNSLREIKMWFDSYNDLFSDFDPNPYSNRVLSDDFLFQLKKVTKTSTKESIRLNFLFPDKLRNNNDEQNIAERLQTFFNLNKNLLIQQRKRSINKGIRLSSIGIILMIIAGYISFLNPNSFYIHLILILFEPAGWFLLWMGLERVLNSSGKTKKELSFYSKMADTTIEFSSY